MACSTAQRRQVFLAGAAVRAKYRSRLTVRQAFCRAERHGVQWRA
jgi:hypothetical protein